MGINIDLNTRDFAILDSNDAELMQTIKCLHDAKAHTNNKMATDYYIIELTLTSLSA